MPDATADLTALVHRLEAIAQKNDDHFRYRIEIDPDSSRSYTFICEESADHHCFIEANGSTLALAVKNTEFQVESACEDWRYVDA